MNWTAFVLGFLAMWAGIALYRWLSRPKRVQGYDRYGASYDRYGAPPALDPNEYSLTVTSRMSEEGMRQLVADLIAAMPPDDTPEREAALQALMTSIQGRFTSRSEEPNDA